LLCHRFLKATPSTRSLRFIAAPYSLFSESAPIFKSSNKQKYGWEQERIPLKRFGVDQIE